MVQIPNTKIQIGCKGQPEQIGNLQFCGQRICFPECQCHPQHQSPQKQQPQEGKSIGFGIEENGTPEEIYHQLDNKKIQTQTACFGRSCQTDSGGTYAHEGVQKRPYHREYPAGRGERRFYNTLGIKFGSFSGKPSGQDAYSLGKKDPEKIRFPVSFHDASPGTGYASCRGFILPAELLPLPQLPDP